MVIDIVLGLLACVMLYLFFSEKRKTDKLQQKNTEFEEIAKDFEAISLDREEKIKKLLENDKQYKRFFMQFDNVMNYNGTDEGQVDVDDAE